jgi:hypothetical protein
VTWPPQPRPIASLPGVSYTVVACPHLGVEWLFSYFYLDVDRG